MTLQKSSEVGGSLIYSASQASPLSAFPKHGLSPRHVLSVTTLTSMSMSMFVSDPCPHSFEFAFMFMFQCEFAVLISTDFFDNR
jgi:hypothetical protein